MLLRYLLKYQVKCLSKAIQESQNILEKLKVGKFRQLHIFFKLLKLNFLLLQLQNIINYNCQNHFLSSPFLLLQISDEFRRSKWCTDEAYVTTHQNFIQKIGENSLIVFSKMGRNVT